MKRTLALLLCMAMLLSIFPSAFADAPGSSAETRSDVPAAAGPDLEELSDYFEEEIIPEEILPEETAPEETAPEETAPEETIPEENVPEENVPEETIPEETIPEETIPEEAAPEETDPEDPEELPVHSAASSVYNVIDTSAGNVGITLTNTGLLQIGSCVNNSRPTGYYDMPEYKPWRAAAYIDTVTSVTICKEVTSICSNAFANCSNLRSVSWLYENGIAIKSRAFYNCTSLESVWVDRTYAIAADAFLGCTSLYEFRVSSDKKPFSAVDGVLFNKDKNLLHIYPAGKADSVYTVPKSVTALSSYAFAECKNLDMIIFTGSQPTIGSTTFLNTTATIVYPHSWSKDICQDYGGNLTWIDEAEILAQPQDLTVQENTKATFSAEICGRVTYQWQYSKDGGTTWVNSTSASGKTAKYSFTTACSQDGRLVRCIATSITGKKVTTDSVQLTVVPFKITSQPKNTTVHEGTTAKFSIAASGLGLTYQWQYSKDGGKNWTNSTASSGTSKTYSTTAALSMDSRMIRCVVTSACGAALTSDSVKLTVKTLKITSQPADVSSMTGKTVTFSVSATGVGLTYQWQYSKDGGRNWIDSTASSGKTSKYSVTTSVNMDGRLVRCIITAPNGSKKTSNPASLTISFGISAQPKSATIQGNESASFSISVIGTGLSYQWQYSNDDGLTWENSTASSGKQSTYTITTKAFMDGRLIRCIVKNSAGQKLTSKAVKLTVIPFVITAQPKSTSQNVDGKASFSITATGIGLTYQWQYSSDSGKTWKNSTSSTGTSAVYSHTAASSMDGRLIRCIVTSAPGKTLTSSVAKLTVVPVKITAQPKNASAAEGQKATFSVSTSGLDLSYQWQYSKDSGKHWVNSTSASGKTAKYSFTTACSQDGRLVRCIITAPSGQKLVSGTAKLTVSLGITQHPQDQVVQIDSKATFSITAIGQGLQYQWQFSKDGGETWTTPSASSAKTSSYSFTVGSTMDGRLLRCIVKNSDGKELISGSAALTAVPPLQITAHPTDATVTANSTARFSITAEGMGLTYQWQYSPDFGNTWTSYSLASAKTRTFSFSASTSMNGILLRCIVTDILGTQLISDSAILFVEQQYPWSGSYVNGPFSSCPASFEVPLSAGSRMYLSFKPTTSGTYVFESSGSYDTYASLYQSDGTLIVSNDDGGTDRNFKISTYLYANTTYYLEMRFYSSSTAGTFALYITKS